MNSSRVPSRWLLVSGLVAVLVVGVGLRVFRLPQLPVGLHYDEAANGILAGEIAQGLTAPIFIAAYTGKEVLFFYWTALWMTLLGVTPLALRLAAASAGTATIVATFWVTYELLRGEAEALWVALTSSAFLAVSFWHLVLSRYGFRAVTQPLLQALTVAALWRGLRSGKRTWFVAAGLFCGLTAYTYLAARAFPLPLSAALVVVLIADRHRRRERLVQLTIFLGAAALVLAPLAHYWLTHPGTFMLRTRQVAAGSWSEVRDGLTACLGMFFLRGDPYIRFNLPFRPLFLPPAAVLALLGLGDVLWRSVRGLLPQHRVQADTNGDRAGWASLSLASYTFLLLTIPVMVLPSALATEEITPSNLRTVGLLPFLYIFPAVGLFRLKVVLARGMDWLGIGNGNWWVSSWLNLGLLVFLLAVGIPATGGVYFRQWAPAASLYNASDGDMAAVADYLNELNLSSTTVYVASEHYRHPTLAFLADDYEDVRWLVTGKTLVFPPRGDGLLVFPRSVAQHLHWIESMLDSDRLEASPPGLDGPAAFHAYRITAADVPLPQQSWSADFDHAAHLVGYAVTAPPRADDLLPVAVWWNVANAPDGHDFGPILRLVDGEGLLWGETQPFHYPSEQWARGEVIVDLLSVPVMAGAPPGAYTLRLGFYSPRGDVRLPLLDDSGAYAGMYVELPVHLQRADSTPHIDDLGIREMLNVDIDGLTLLGTSLDATAVRPGERVYVTLFWRAARGDLSPLPLALRLGDTDLYRGDPVHGTYPFDEWTAGEVVQDRYALRIPLEFSPGDYLLEIQLGPTQIELGGVQVRETDRTFQVPSMSHPLSLSLGDRVELLGYDVSTESVAPGETLTVTLYWRALTEVDRDYTVFVHLLAPDGSMTGQSDAQPVHGTYPTSLWMSDEVVTDVHEIAVPPEALPGGHRLEVGMYVAEDGTRLPVESTPDNAIRLTTVIVEE